MSFKKSLIFIIFFFCILEKALSFQSPVDILIFSPHPDDEILCCGGTIAHAIEAKKNVKIVFFTNGDAYSLSARFFLKQKSGASLTRDSYLALGSERQKEAVRAARSLGVKEKDLIFLSYPDRGLAYLWEEKYEGMYSSKTTGADSSTYQNTYKRARKGYTKENLLLDIEDILKQYRPKRIYTPFPLDSHSDHSASTQFLYLAMDELRNEENNWINGTEIFYYCVRQPKETYFLSGPDYAEDITDCKVKKESALSEYSSQKMVEEAEILFADFAQKDKERFWNNNTFTSREYLQRLEDEWSKIGTAMRGKGYNLNFGVVADVAGNTSSLNNRLMTQGRMYSDNPSIVAQLVLPAVKGMNSAGVVPVVKHFPGLGQGDEDDPHVWLPYIPLSKKELYRKALIPYTELIKNKSPIWIMVDHAVYPSLDDKPASFSYKIITELLRNELGFQGIVITDELWSMLAPQHYVSGLGITKPYIGEIVVRVFEAGADFALVYVSPEEAERVITEIIGTVKNAVKENRIKEKDLDVSVARILEEKERIFGIPLKHVLREMTLEEKITQRLMFDVYTDKEVNVFKKFTLGGVRMRKAGFADQLRESRPIPMFIAGEQEGGKVTEAGLNSINKSAYIVGREFENLLLREGTGTVSLVSRKWNPHPRSDMEIKNGETDNQLPVCRVLCLAAHPDDEDGEALAYLRKKFKCQTYILLATRGEGGENKISTARNEELGVLRSREMEKAASLLGVSQVYYLGKPDFGYSDSLSTVWKEWNHDDTLKEMVYYYRLIRPHIVISKHNRHTTSAQHLAVAVLGEEAFDLAGNAAVFPEQLNDGLFTWQTLRLYQRTTDTQYDVVIDAGEVALPENKTYHELALQALSQHRSQGGVEGLLGKDPHHILNEIFYSLVKSNRSFKAQAPPVPEENAEKVVSEITKGPDRPMPGQDVVIEKDTYFAENKDISPLGLFVTSGTVRIKSAVTLTVGKDRGIHVGPAGKIELEKDASIKFK